MARTDLLGTWDFIGTLAPKWNNWDTFTFQTSSPYNVMMVNCLSVPDVPKSVGYLRAVFYTPDPIYSGWLKFFPKPEKELYSLPIPSEIFNNADRIRRGFQIMKLPKRRPTYQPVIETPWSVTLEVLSKSGLSNLNPLGELDLDVPIGDDVMYPSSIWGDLLGLDD